MMHKLHLFRDDPGPLATLGTWTLDGGHLGYTLENTARIIPAGTYDLGVHASPPAPPGTNPPGHFGRDMVILRIPGWRNILIHEARRYTDLLGCIGTAPSRTTNGARWPGMLGSGSRDLVDWIESLLIPAIRGGTPCTIEVSNA